MHLEFSYNDTKFIIEFYNPSKKDIIDVFVKKIDIIHNDFELSISANLGENEIILSYDCLIKRMDFNCLMMHSPLILFSLRGPKENYNEIQIKDYLLKDINIQFNGFIPELFLLDEESFFKEIDKLSETFGEKNHLIKSLKKNIKKESKFFMFRFLGGSPELNKDDLPPLYPLFYYFEKDVLINLLNKIRYIGPLRDEPHRFYQFFNIRNLNIGNRGEFAAQLFTLYSDSEIPPFKIFLEKNDRVLFHDCDSVNLTLKKGLSIWSDILDLPEINPQKVEGILYKILVSLQKKDAQVTLRDVGFGISQILPVYIESLRRNKNETLILEQPEIHLHPNMQSKLADFLLSMTVSGKKFIVETHSEYLINRICLRIAQDPTNELKDLISILFVEQPIWNKDNGYRGSIIKPVEVNKFGEIVNWPIGFFDTNDYKKILKAGIFKKNNDEGKS